MDDPVTFRINTTYIYTYLIKKNGIVEFVIARVRGKNISPGRSGGAEGGQNAQSEIQLTSLNLNYNIHNMRAGTPDKTCMCISKRINGARMFCFENAGSSSIFRVQSFFSSI